MGLLFVAVLGAVALWPAIKNPQSSLKPRLIGATAAALGAYFTFGVTVYFLAGGYYARRMAWYELIVPHNPYLWCVALLPAGILLMFVWKNRL